MKAKRMKVKKNATFHGSNLCVYKLSFYAINNGKVEMRKPKSKTYCLGTAVHFLPWAAYKERTQAKGN